MFKVLTALTVFAALWIGVVFCGDCLNLNQVWGDQDPSIFYYCNTTTNQSETVNCPVGTGFVSNQTASGCIPWSDWSDECIDKTQISAITCENDTYLRPTGSGNPAVFYLCLAQNSTPVEVDCEAGRGFYGKNKYLGCYPWALWRNITGCLLE